MLMSVNRHGSGSPLASSAVHSTHVGSHIFLETALGTLHQVVNLGLGVGGGWGGSVTEGCPSTWRKESCSPLAHCPNHSQHHVQLLWQPVRHAPYLPGMAASQPPAHPPTQLGTPKGGQAGRHLTWLCFLGLLGCRAGPCNCSFFNQYNQGYNLTLSQMNIVQK